MFVATSHFQPWSVNYDDVKRTLLAYERMKRTETKNQRKFKFHFPYHILSKHQQKENASSSFIRFIVCSYLLFLRFPFTKRSSAIIKLNITSQQLSHFIIVRLLVFHILFIFSSTFCTIALSVSMQPVSIYTFIRDRDRKKRKSPQWRH